MQARLGGEVHGFEGQVEVPDHRVVHVLGPNAVHPDVVGAPEGPKPVAAGGELTDEVGEGSVVG
ncbi:MAG TPA: hypothetical protein VF635_06770 [Propionibacteriaceae bacterium]